MQIGKITHPKHGVYFIWFDGSCYGITRKDKPTHCAYASLQSLFATKGF